MLYFPELYYFFDTKNFPIDKAELVTAKKISEWCIFYKAGLVTAKQGIKEKIQEDKLPDTIEEKHKMIQQLFDWINSNSQDNSLFTLFLNDKEIINNGVELNKFDHHDDTCCWILNLLEQEFKELQNAWQEAGLPKNLFYLEGTETKIIKPNGLIGTILTKFGFTIENSKIYTPKRWEAKQKN